MRFKVLASGSKGNSTYIETNELKILIDIGIGYQRLENELSNINISPKELDAILITHTHHDHINGLQALVKKTNLKVYITEEMEEEILNKIPSENIKLLEDNFNIKDLEIELIHTSHDVDSVGYILTEKNKTLVYVTDTGYINRKYLKRIIDKNAYVIESNHDEKMVMDGPYPFILKQRVISDKGHLSNYTTAEYLTGLVGENTKYVILAHISENNNTEELAYQTTKNRFIEEGIEQEILLAKQYESLDLLEI